MSHYVPTSIRFSFIAQGRQHEQEAVAADELAGFPA